MVEVFLLVSVLHVWLEGEVVVVFVYVARLEEVAFFLLEEVEVD